MSIQSQHAVATRPAPQPERADVPAHRALLRALILAGARGATPAAVTAALMRYWQELRSASVTQRSQVVAELRGAVRRDETTSRAWLTVALGETDPGLVREAVLGYLGVTPVSIERRERVAGDALDWIRRGLALNRGAVFVAKARGEGGEAAHDVIDCFADSRATRLEGVCTVRQWRQHGWKIDRWH